MVVRKCEYSSSIKEKSGDWKQLPDLLHEEKGGETPDHRKGNSCLNAMVRGIIK